MVLFGGRMIWRPVTKESRLTWWPCAKTESEVNLCGVIEELGFTV